MTESQISSERRATTSDSSAVAFISVIVPIFNEEKFIAQTLDGLLEQDYPVDSCEILVVDGESFDRTREIVSEYVDRYPHIQLLSNPKRWASAARNVGIDAASGDVILIVDGHCQFIDDQYLRNVDRAFRHEDVHCLGRPQPLDVSGGNQIQSAIAAARSSRLGHHPDSYIYSSTELKVPAHSVAVAYRKSVFETVGKFDEDFDACEDVELNHRVDKAGLTCLLAPSIKLRYYPRASLKSLFRQMARYGRGRVRLLRKHADTFSFKSMIPGLFLFGLVAGAVASLIFPVLAIPYLSVVGLYAVIILGFSLMLAMQEKKLSLVWLLPVVFGVIHFGAGYGLLKETFLGKSSDDPLDR